MSALQTPPKFINFYFIPTPIGRFLKRNILKYINSLNETIVRDEGSYTISSNTNVTVFSFDEVTLNYNGTSDDVLCNNLIDMVNITGNQTIIVNGFVSSNSSDMNVQTIEVPIALLIGVIAFGIYSPSRLTIVPILLSPLPSLYFSTSSQAVSTRITFDDGEQSIILNNVNA